MRSCSKIVDGAESRRNGLNQLIVRAHTGYAQTILTRKDLERIYSGVFLEWCTTVEGTIEELFFGLLTGRLSHSDQNTRSLVTIKSANVARRAVSGGKPYVDWLPVDQTKERAKAFLASGKPFDRITGFDKEALTQMHTIRNAIAHHSNHANRRFLDTVVGRKAVPPAQRRPGGYLQGQHATGQSRLDFHMAETLRVLRGLT